MEGGPLSERDAREDWRRFAPASIPTKLVTPLLDGFLEECRARHAPGVHPTLLDVGCGDGRLSLRMHERGFAVTGVDVNEQAIHAARRLPVAGDRGQPPPRFLVADAAGFVVPHAVGGPFDVVVCQLVVSIVGEPADRARLLGTCSNLLRPGGRIFVSASGVSGDINPEYARLYAVDVAQTGEPFTYYSRDRSGEILYATHHFSMAELDSALTAAGLTGVAISAVSESSSRRPDERAIFLYATASRPPDTLAGGPRR